MPQSTLTVWKFANPEGARDAVRTLEDMQKQDLLTILDFATVSWEEGKKKPTTKQGSPTTSAGALGGAFWGMLFGLIFFVPLLGAAVGAATGALTGSLADVGHCTDRTPLSAGAGWVGNEGLEPPTSRM